MFSKYELTQKWEGLNNCCDTYLIVVLITWKLQKMSVSNQTCKIKIRFKICPYNGIQNISLYPLSYKLFYGDTCQE